MIFALIAGILIGAFIGAAGMACCAMSGRVEQDQTIAELRRKAQV